MRAHGRDELLGGKGFYAASNSCTDFSKPFLQNNNFLKRDL